MAHDATMIATTSTKATRSGRDMRAGVTQLKNCWNAYREASVTSQTTITRT